MKYISTLQSVTRYDLRFFSSKMERSPRQSPVDVTTARVQKIVVANKREFHFSIEFQGNEQAYDSRGISFAHHCVSSIQLFEYTKHCQFATRFARFAARPSYRDSETNTRA